MNSRNNQVNALDFQEDLLVEKERQKEFAYSGHVWFKHEKMMRRFKTFLNNAPPVSLEGLYDLTVELLALGRTNVVRLLLEHEPKVARYSQASGLRPSFLHFCIPGFCISDDMIELVLDAYPEASSKMDRKGFLPLHLALMSLRSSSETYIRTTVAIAISRCCPCFPWGVVWPFSIAFLFGTRQYECIRGFHFGYDWGISRSCVHQG
jgi:hypothetical protein